MRVDRSVGGEFGMEGGGEDFAFLHEGGMAVKFGENL